MVDKSGAVDKTQEAWASVTIAKALRTTASRKRNA
jgi:hypothetical protein